MSREDIGFDAEDNEVTVLMADGTERRVPFGPKLQVARSIVDTVEVLRGGDAPGATSEAS